METKFRIIVVKEETRRPHYYNEDSPEGLSDFFDQSGLVASPEFVGAFAVSKGTRLRSPEGEEFEVVDVNLVFYDYKREYPDSNLLEAIAYVYVQSV